MSGRNKVSDKDRTILDVREAGRLMGEVMTKGGASVEEIIAALKLEPEDHLKVLKLIEDTPPEQLDDILSVMPDIDQSEMTVDEYIAAFKAAQKELARLAADNLTQPQLDRVSTQHLEDARSQSEGIISSIFAWIAQKFTGKTTNTR